MPTNDNGFTVFGGIEEKWLALGAAGSPLGHPVTNETLTFDGAGRYQNFQFGSISWNPRPEMGAHAVYGAIGERWIQIGREQFGYPLTDEAATGDGRGRYNHFRAFQSDGTLIGESSIFWQPATGAHEIYGGIRDFWAAQGWERSSFGFPVDAEHDRSDGPGREQHFEHGRIVWTPEAGASAAHPSISLQDRVTHILVAGSSFTPGNQVKIFYQYQEAGLDGVRHFHSNGVDPLVSLTGNDGSFSGVSFDLNGSGAIAYIQVKGVDAATNQEAIASLRGDA